MKVLVVKTSSMGDVVHTFPAVQDAVEARPDIVFDWCVEEPFCPIAALHPAIRTVVPVALRRWRKTLLSASTRDEIGALKTRLRHERYDLVLDAQGLLKSALVARLPGAPTAGYDRHSIREPLASLFYQRRLAVPRSLHAIERNRRLFGLALGYAPDFSRIASGVETSPADASTAFLLHGTSREDKKWPAEHWAGTARLLAGAGWTPVTTFSNPDEKAVAEGIKAAAPETRLLPRSGLEAVAAALRDCGLAVGADTGLMHLAAAFGLPTVAIFTATEPGLTGPRGKSVTTLTAAPAAPVTPETVFAAAARLVAERDGSAGDFRRT